MDKNQFIHVMIGGLVATFIYRMTDFVAIEGSFELFKPANEESSFQVYVIGFLLSTLFIVGLIGILIYLTKKS